MEEIGERRKQSVVRVTGKKTRRYRVEEVLRQMREDSAQRDDKRTAISVATVRPAMAVARYVHAEGVGDRRRADGRENEEVRHTGEGARATSGDEGESLKAMELSVEATETVESMAAEQETHPSDGGCAAKEDSARRAETPQNIEVESVVGGDNSSTATTTGGTAGQSNAVGPAGASKLPSGDLVDQVRLARRKAKKQAKRQRADSRAEAARQQHNESLKATGCRSSPRS
ncbi:hypothetical protein PF008_g15257 [Phytophthora fragariae]|uniref:Uncharacterized protein n=1 Tax=Phytophthora fragariae TaxID=53985 RepID=A0A6G0REM2_9STRA|nr:hypothetical protein PF008_g15257 [Phytophthora fragariae]